MRGWVENFLKDQGGGLEAAADRVSNSGAADTAEYGRGRDQRALLAAQGSAGGYRAPAWG